MSLLSGTEDGLHIVEVIGRSAWVFPSFASFLVYYVLKAQLIQNLWNLLELSKIFMEHSVKLILFPRS